MKKLLPYLQLHTAIFLFGFTGILGRVIGEEGISGPLLVWYRLILTLITLLFVPKIFSKIREIPVASRWRIVGIGVLVCLHWVTFYTAIQVSNVSLSLSCLAATPFFVAFLEPLIFKRKIEITEILLGAIVIVGFVFVFGFSLQYKLGIIFGLLSALFAAIFSVLNKGIVSKYDTYAIMAIEFWAGLILLTLTAPIHLHYFPVAHLIPQTFTAWGSLIVLVLLCTTFAYTLSLLSLRHISAFTASLSINLEPVYGIIMAYFWFHENQELNAGFYVGILIILSAVFVHAFLKIRLSQKLK